MLMKVEVQWLPLCVMAVAAAAAERWVHKIAVGNVERWK